MTRITEEELIKLSKALWKEIEEELTNYKITLNSSCIDGSFLGYRRPHVTNAPACELEKKFRGCFIKTDNLGSRTEDLKLVQKRLDKARATCFGLENFITAAGSRIVRIEAATPKGYKAIQAYNQKTTKVKKSKPVLKSKSSTGVTVKDGIYKIS